MWRRSWSAGLATFVVALTTVACAGSPGDGGTAASTTSAVATTSVATTSAAATSAAATSAAPTVVVTPTAPRSLPPVTGVSPTGSSAPSPAATAGGAVAPEGFATVPGVVTAADGSTCAVCLWLADDPGLRAQGLMGVTDLAGADGMVFRWDEPTTGNFWMRDTPSPLSIAFFDAAGAFVSAADMTPCLQPTPDAECARYAAAGPYAYAVEVAAGGLPPLLMGPGSRLELLPGDCPLAG